VTQDQLIPNAVFLLPLLKEISDLGGPIQVETLESLDELKVRSYDDIIVPVDGVDQEKCRITITLADDVTEFDITNARPLSPFHAAWITEALLAHLVRHGHKVSLKLEEKDGIDTTAIGVNQGTGPASSKETVYLVCEAFLDIAHRGRRHSEGQSLNRATQDRIFAIREQRQAAERERRAAEAKAEAADLN
jgi:hypothetical protein